MESSKRIKLSLSKKLKEYANKMGRDHLGGDDIPGNKKKGGLRDFDGYDNVQYNRDMPMDEDSPEGAHPQGSKKLTNRTTVMDMLDVISHKEFGPDYHKLSTKQKKEVHKLAIKGKLIKQSPFKESVNESGASINKRRAGAELKQKLKGKRSDGMGKYTATIYGLDSKGKRVELKSLNDLNKYSKFEIDESVNESTSKEAMGIAGFTGTRGNAVQKFIDDYNLDARKLFNFVKKGKLKDRMEFVSAIAGKPGNKFQGKMVGMFGESVNENITLFNDFLLEGGLPQNWMAGRVSDYHTKLRGKRKDYDDTNFAKMNTGQPDIEDEELDPDNEVVNEKFDKVEHLSLLNKALRAIPGSNKQKDIIRQLNVVRKAGGMRPLKEQSIVEYASRLTNAYILDDESVLDGTPEEKDAINRESAKKKTEKNYKDWKSTNESLKDMVGDTYTFSIGSGDEQWIKPNTKEYVIEKIAETIKHNLYDWDFSLNGIDGSQAKEYSKIFDNDVLKPLLRNIDKTLKTYFKIDSKNKKISWKLSFRDNDKIIDAFFKKNKKISSDIRDSYFSQNEVAKRDYKDEYKKFQSSTKSKKYRAELNKYNRDKGTYGNGDNKDASHKGGKIVGFESASKNRGRKEKSRLKKK